MSPTSKTTRLLACLTLSLSLIISGCAAVRPAAQEKSATDNGLLWRIEKGDKVAGYLFGTMHVEDPRVLRLSPVVQQTFDHAGAFVMEAVLDQGAVADIQKRMFYADGPGLAAVIGPDMYARVVTAIKEHGLPPTMAERMRPWAVLSILSTPKEGTGMFLDRRLQVMAEQAGKPVHGLETIAEQLRSFEKIPEAEQIELLRDTLDNLADVDEWLEKATLAYLSGDLDRIETLHRQSLTDVEGGAARQFEKNILVDRNHRMAERMEAHLHSGEHPFVAVGVLHLPGDEGLLKLLQREGYTVSAVK